MPQSFKCIFTFEGKISHYYLGGRIENKRTRQDRFAQIVKK